MRASETRSRLGLSAVYFGINAREDAEFLARYDPADFERPSVAVDVALISVLANTLVVQRLRGKLKYTTLAFEMLPITV